MSNIEAFRENIRNNLKGATLGTLITFTSACAGTPPFLPRPEISSPTPRPLEITVDQNSPTLLFEGEQTPLNDSGWTAEYASSEDLRDTEKARGITGNNRLNLTIVDNAGVTRGNGFHLRRTPEGNDILSFRPEGTTTREEKILQYSENLVILRTIKPATAEEIYFVFPKKPGSEITPRLFEIEIYKPKKE